MGIYIGQITFNEMLSMSGEQLYDLIRSYNTTIEEVFEPHGKLIDADTLTKAICEYEYADTTSTEKSIGANHCRELIDKSFPIIDESWE